MPDSSPIPPANQPPKRRTGRFPSPNARPLPRITERNQRPGELPPTMSRPADVPSTHHTAPADAVAIAVPIPVAGHLDHFELGEPLGRGGMGIVRSATDHRLQRELAIKLLQHDDETARAKFIEEAQITGQLQHPNIVPVYEMGRDGRGQPYLAMKRIHGRTLAEAIHAAHETTRAHPAEVSRKLRQLLEILLKVCDGMAYAHSQGVIHRDLKPANVMVGEFGEVLIVDWGLAKPLGRTPAAPETGGASAANASTASARRTTRRIMTNRRLDGQTTLQGHVSGTPAYMAPEQAVGESELVDERTDIYALGGILYTILTGELPITGDTTEAQLIAVREHRVAPPSQIAPAVWVPRELEAVVQKAMARRPRDRYASIAALREDIENFLEGRTLEAADYTHWQRAMKWAMRHKAAVVSGAALMFALFVGMIAVVLVALTEQDRLRAETEKRTAELAAAAQREQSRELEVKAERDAFEREKAEIAAREAQLRALAQQGQIDQLIGQLGGQLVSERDRIVQEFYSAHKKAQAEGISPNRFVESLGKEKVRQYVADLERLIAAHDEHPERIPIEATDYFLLGVLHQMGLGNGEAAENAYSRAIELAPDSPNPYLNRANIRRDAGRFDEALADYERALKLKPENFLAHFNRGTLYQKMGKHTDALAEYLQAAAFDRDDIRPFLQRGIIFRTMGDLDASESELTIAISRGGALVAIAQFNRGITRRQLDNFDGALADLTAALDGRPDDAAILVERAMTLRELKRHTEARADVERALAANPNLALGHSALGLVLGDAGDWEAAAKAHDHAVELDPTEPQILSNRAMARRKLGNPAGAIDDYTQILAMRPTDVRALTDRGTARQEAKDFDGAKADYDAALTIQPDYVNAIANLASLQFLRGDSAAAIATYDRAIALRPAMAELWHHRGFVRIKAGQYADAIPDFDGAIARNPDYTDAYFQRGNARRETGDIDGALADFEKAVALNPDSIAALHNRGSIWQTKREFDKALADFDAVIERSPRYWQSWAMRGKVLALMGRRDDAITSFDTAEKLCDADDRARVRHIRQQVLGN